MGNGLIMQALMSRSFVNIAIMMVGSFCMGVAIAYPSPTSWKIAVDFTFSSAEIGTFGAITSLTAIAGPIITGPLLKYGRCVTCQAIAAINIVAWFIMIFAESHAKMPIIHRAVIGIAAGGYSAVIPMFIMELSPAEYRNVFGSMHQFGITLGITLTNFFGVFVTWKTLAWMGCLMALAFLLLCPLVQGSGGQQISRSEQRSSTADHGTSTAQYRPYVIIACLLMFFQQVSGINAVLTNLGSILASRFGPTFAASAQCIAVFVCITVVDSIGRMKAWAISLFGSAASMFILAISQVCGMGNVIPAMAAFGFNFFFCFALGPMPWVLIPEFFPERMRGSMSGLCSSLNWFLSFTVILIYPMLTDKIGTFGTMLIFTAVLVCGGFFGFYALAPKQPGNDFKEEKVDTLNVALDRNGFDDAASTDSESLE